MRFQPFVRTLCGFVLLMGVFGFAALHPVPAYGCSCAFEDDPSAAFGRSAAVFSGKVVSTGGLFSEWFNQTVRVSFEVTEVWKGPQGNRIALNTGRGGGDCGFGFERGEEYLVYAYESQDHPLTGDGLAANICSRTRTLATAENDLLVLGTGIRPAADVASSALLPTVLAVLTGAMAVVVMIVVLVRRRTRGA